MNAETPKQEDLKELQDGKLDDKDIQELTKKVEDPDFCQNFANTLKANEGTIVNTLTTCIDNQDISTEVLTNFLQSLNSKSDEYVDLKAAIQKKIDNNKNAEISILDLQSQVDNIYKENGIEKDDVQKVLDYITTNKNNPGLITLLDKLTADNNSGLHIKIDKWDGYIGTIKDFTTKVQGLNLPTLDIKQNTPSNPITKESIETKSVDVGRELVIGDNKTDFITAASHPELFTKDKDGNFFPNIEAIKTQYGEDKIQMILPGATYEKGDNKSLITGFARDGENAVGNIDNNLDNIKAQNKGLLFIDADGKLTFSHTEELTSLPEKGDILTLPSVKRPGKDINQKYLEEANRPDGNNYLILKTDGSHEIVTLKGDVTTQKKALENSNYERVLSLDVAGDNGQLNGYWINQNNKLTYGNHKTGDILRDNTKTPTTEVKGNMPSLLIVFKPKESNNTQNIAVSPVTIDLPKTTASAQTPEITEKSGESKDLQGYVDTPLDGKSLEDVQVIAEGLFEKNETAYNQLFDKTTRESLNPKQQENLTKMIYAYFGKEATATNSLKDIDFKTITAADKSSYPIDTKIISLKADPSIQIAFGSYEHVQKNKANIVSEDEIKRLKDVLINDPKAIFVEMADTGSYALLEKLLKSYDKPEDRIKILKTLVDDDIITSLDQSATTKSTTAETKTIEKQKLLSQQIADQKEGYLNVIRNQIIDIVKTVPKPGVDSDGMRLFESYLTQCTKNPKYLGDNIQTRMNNHNALVGARNDLLKKDPNYALRLSQMSEEQLKGNPHELRDKNILNMIQNLYKDGLKEYDKQYGIKAQLEGLFGSFKDQIVMIANFLGFDKADALRMFGMNESLKKVINTAYEKAYKLEDNDKAVINKMHDQNSAYIATLNTIQTNDGDSAEKIIDTFTTSVDANTFITALKDSGTDGQTVDRGFIVGLMNNYNTNNPNDKISYEPGTDNKKINPGREKVIEKAWKDPFIKNALLKSSQTLEDMAKKTYDTKDKSGQKSYEDAKHYTIENLNKNPLVAVSYYLSTMIVAGEKDLHYKVSENVNKEINNGTPTKKENADTKNTIAIQDGKSDTIDKDGKILKDTKLEDVLDMTKAPEYITIQQENGTNVTVKKVDKKYVDQSSKDANTLHIGEKIIASSQEDIDTFTAPTKVAEKINNATEWIKKNSDTNATNYEKDYTENVTKPIFDLFTTESTYDYMHSHDTEDKTLKDPTTFQKFFDYALTQEANKGSTIKIDTVKKVTIAAKTEKITFNIVDKTGTKTLTIDNTGEIKEVKTTSAA